MRISQGVILFFTALWNILIWYYHHLVIWSWPGTPSLTSKPLLTIALKILKTIEKPLVPMVGPPKKHSMVVVQLCQNHWKTIDGNGGLKKTLTIPSPWKIDHRSIGVTNLQILAFLKIFNIFSTSMYWCLSFIIEASETLIFKHLEKSFRVSWYRGQMFPISALFCEIYCGHFPDQLWNSPTGQVGQVWEGQRFCKKILHFHFFVWFSFYCGHFSDQLWLGVW